MHLWASPGVDVRPHRVYSTAPFLATSNAASHKLTRHSLLLQEREGRGGRLEGDFGAVANALTVESTALAADCRLSGRMWSCVCCCPMIFRQRHPLPSSRDTRDPTVSLISVAYQDAVSNAVWFAPLPPQPAAAVAGLG